MACLQRIALRPDKELECSACPKPTKDLYIGEYDEMEGNRKIQTLGFLCFCSPECLLKYPSQGSC